MNRTALYLISAAALTAAAPALADETKPSLQPHTHGVSKLDAAIEGQTFSLALRAPGADIVGFEHEATTAEDKAAIEAALAQLKKPQELFVLPAAAGCAVETATAALESGAHHDHDHEEHADHDDDHDHEEHADHDGDHDHEEHADHDDDHDHEEHADHDDDHDHEEHAGEDHDHDHDHGHGVHSEFEAEYAFHCDSPNALTSVDFAYFSKFKGAQEIEMRLLTEKGYFNYEIERDAASLDLREAL